LSINPFQLNAPTNIDFLNINYTNQGLQNQYTRGAMTLVIQNLAAPLHIKSEAEGARN
jgi:hypothetical protein